MTRYFTVEQAALLLPEIQRLVRRAQRAQGKLWSEQAAIEEFMDSLAAIQDHGVQVKDLDAGLVDFPTRYLGQDALLCYRMGDVGISHWQAIESGDGGRLRIDHRFLENHSGGAIQ